MAKTKIMDRSDCAKFADLSKSQKQFIVRLLEVFPEYSQGTDLTLKQISTAYFKLKDMRSNSGEKLGFPLWLQKTNIVGRGIYQMPWATEAELTETCSPKPKVVPQKNVKTRLEKIIENSEPVQLQEIEDFNKILRENGIEV